MRHDDPDLTFTVFTPTYNRARTLHRVFDSLAAQTSRDFEWLIVDDGSGDGTSELVAGWQSTAAFPIRYIVQDHGGKHVAFNRGVREARGRLFLTFDSDDSCVPTALERFQALWEGIPAPQRDAFSAVTVLASDESGTVVGDRFVRDIDDSDSLEKYFLRPVAGEKWGFQRTDVLRRFPFPEPTDVTFVPESIIWFAIAREYKTRYVNEVLRVYHRGDAGGNLSDLTPATARGRLMFHRVVIEDYLDYLPRAPRVFMRSLVNYARYSWLSGRGPLQQVRTLRSIRRKLLVIPFVPIGGIVAMRDRR